MDAKKLMWDIGCGELTHGLTFYAVTPAQLEMLISKVTEDAAGLVSKKDAEIAELKQHMVDGVTVQQYINIDNECDALKAENLGYAKSLLDLEAEVERLRSCVRKAIDTTYSDSLQAEWIAALEQK